KKADGSGLMKNLHNLPKAMLDELKKLNKDFWVRYEENILFLTAIKGGKGSQKIFDEYIKPGAKQQVNIPDTQVKNIVKAMVQNVGDAKWSDPAWGVAIAEIQKMVKESA